MRKLWITLFVFVVVVVVAGVGLKIWDYLAGREKQIGKIQDEAALAGRTPESLPGADEDYYADMDYGLTKNPEAIRASLDPFIPGITADAAVKAAVAGRNNWIVWTAGNDRLWDLLSVKSVGNLDLLK